MVVPFFIAMRWLVGSGTISRHIRLASAATLPTGTGETHIATISGWNAIIPIYTSAPAIQGSGTIHVSLQSNGKLYIANLSGSSASA